jgi:hypothetical protein
MADLLALEKLCNDLPDRIEQAASDLVCEVIIQMATNLIEHTPVDITTAASNWIASLNTPNLFELPAIVPGTAGSTAGQSRSEAVEHVRRVVADKEPGEAVWLSNIVPYMVYLTNYGTSKQEPAGFFERGVLVGVSYAATATLGIKLNGD